MVFLQSCTRGVRTLRSQIVENQSQTDSWVETVRYGVILIEEAKGAANGQNYFQR